MLCFATSFLLSFRTQEVYPIYFVGEIGVEIPVIRFILLGCCTVGFLLKMLYVFLLQVLRNEMNALKEQVQSLLGYMAHCKCDKSRGEGI